MLKRGDLNFMIVMLIVVLAAAAIVLVIVYKGSQAASQSIAQATPSKLRSQISTCKISSQGFTDTDKDGLADFCDPCFGGNDFIQNDQDFVADKCDEQERSTATNPVIACCGNELSGDTTEKQLASCGTKRLVSIDPFQCCRKGTVAPNC